MRFVHTIALNTVSQVAARVISSGASFLVTVAIARYFGLTTYGDIAKIVGFGSLFYVCIDLGMNAIFLRLQEKEQHFNTLLSLRLVIAALLFTLSAFLVLVLPYSMFSQTGYSPLVKLGIIIFSASFFSRAIVFSTSALFQKKLLYHQTAKASLVSSTTTLLLVGCVLFFQLPYLWIVVAYVVGGLVEAGTSLFLLKEKATGFLHNKISKQLLLQSLPLTLLLVLNLVYFRVDVVLLSLFKKSADVGVYDFAYRFFDFFIALPLFLSNSLYPHILQEEKNNRNLIRNISLYTLLFFALGGVLVPFIWFASPLLSLVKTEFAPSITVLRILALFLPVFFATNILQWILIAKKRERFLVFVYGVSLIVNVVLNLLFIPRYSYMASAIITGVSETGVFLLLLGYLFFKI